MKINLEFDTVTKQLVATMDGKLVENFSSASFYLCCEDEDECTYGCNLQTRKVDKANKTSHNEMVYASEDKKPLKSNFLKAVK